MSKANKSNKDEIVKVSAALDEKEALSPLAQLIQKGLYLDRTMQLKKLYDSTPSRYDFIIRPRGFGKRILADTLEALFTHDFDTLKGVAAQDSWQEPYRQVVRLDLSKISNIEKYYYPTLDLSTSNIKRNGLGLPIDLESGAKNESGLAQPGQAQSLSQEQANNKSSQSSAQPNAFQDADIYSFNSDLYTLLFNEITNNSSQEIPIASGMERDGSSEDFSTMLSICSERSAMGQIKDLLDRCRLNSRVLIVENFDVPLISSLHNPRLYNYRSRVLITFMNLLGYFKQIFRHVIFLGSINIDYRKGKDEYPPFMDYLPMSKEFSYSKFSSTLLGFTREDLTSKQFKPWLEKALAKMQQSCKDANESYMPTMEDLLSSLEDQYGYYSFDKVHTVLNPTSVIAFLTTTESRGIFNSHWFVKNVPNFNYLARIARMTQEEMITFMTIIFAGKLQLTPENVMLPVLINDQGLEDGLGKAQEEAENSDKADPIKEEQPNKATPMAMPDDMLDELVEEIDNNSKELSDLEHSAFASDEGISDLSASDDVAVEVNENGQSVHKAISNEFESIAELRRANDDEILAQGFPGIPFPIIFYAMGYLTCCRIKKGEMFSSVVNCEVFFSLKNILFAHYFKTPTSKQLEIILDDEDFFPYNEKKLRKLIAPLVNNMRLEHFRKPISAKSIRALVMMWLQLQNCTTYVEAIGLEDPLLRDLIAKKQAKAASGVEFNGLSNAEHVPVNELEQALFNAQEQKLKQHKALKEQPQSQTQAQAHTAAQAQALVQAPSELEILSAAHDQNAHSEKLGSVAAVVIDESQETDLAPTEHPIPPRMVNPDEDQSYLLEVDEKDVIEAMERFYKKNTVVVAPNNSQGSQSKANKQETATNSEDVAELELLDTLTDLLDSEDKALLEQQNQAEATKTEQDNKPNKVILPIDLLKPEDFVLTQEEKDKRKRNRRIRLANSNLQTKAQAPQEGSASSQSGSVTGPVDEVLAPGDKRGEIDYAKRASESMDRISKQTWVVNKTIAELTGNAPSSSASAAAAAAAKAKTQPQEIKIHTSNQGRKVLGSNKLTGLAALLATQKQVDELQNGSNADGQSQLDLAKLNDFSNMTVVPKHMVSARLACNIQDLKKSQAEQLWENLEKLEQAEDSALQSSNADKVNQNIIWNWKPYLDLNHQFAIIKEAKDSMQKAKELERIGALAHKDGDDKLASQCEELLSKIEDRSLNDPDFASGKDLGSLFMSQLNYVASHKHPLEANIIFISLLKDIKDQQLLRCFLDGMEILHKINEGHIEKPQSKAEFLDLINVETAQQRMLSFKERAQNLLNISMEMLKDLALQKLAAEATLAKDLDAVIFINKILLSIHDKVEAQINNFQAKDLFNMEGSALPELDGSLEGTRIVKVEVPAEEDDSDDIDMSYSYQLSNKPVARPLNDGEQLLFQLNHVALMADNAYNAISLDEHCNLTLFNDKNALIFEFGVINEEDDANKVVSNTALKLAKVRNPIAAVLDRSAAAKQQMHTISLSLVAKINDDGCTLVDLSKVRDNQESIANGDIQGLYTPYFYRNIQNHLIALVPQNYDVIDFPFAPNNTKSKAPAKAKAKDSTKAPAKAKASARANTSAKVSAKNEIKAPAKPKPKAKSANVTKSGNELQAQSKAKAPEQAKAPSKAKAPAKTLAKGEVKAPLKPKAKSANVTKSGNELQAQSKAKAPAQAKAPSKVKTSAKVSAKGEVKAPAKPKANSTGIAKSGNETQAESRVKASTRGKATAKGNAKVKANATANTKSKSVAASKQAKASATTSTGEQKQRQARAGSKAKTLSKSKSSN